MKQNEAIELLNQYSFCKKFLDSQSYANEFFNPLVQNEIDKKKLYEARIHTIKSLIQLLEPSNEYTFLYLHYIKGISVEKCAECMDVSRRTAFRILKRAHECICDLINKKEEATDERAD